MIYCSRIYTLSLLANSLAFALHVMFATGCTGVQRDDRHRCGEKQA